MCIEWHASEPPTLFKHSGDICSPIFFKKSQQAVRTAEFPDLIESHAIQSSLLSPTSSQVQ
jgi:hypothetical protein